MRWFLALSALLVILAEGAAAQTAVPQSLPQMQLSFAPLVKATSPAVVNVYARTRVRSRSRSLFADDPFFRRFFGDDSFGMPRERAQNSLGSGVIVHSSGVVVTKDRKSVV